MTIDSLLPHRTGRTCLAVGPGLLLAAHLVQLAPDAHDTASELASLADAPGRALASTIIDFAGVVLTVAGILALGQALHERRPRAATTGTWMSVVGGFALAALLGSSPLMVALAQSDGPRELLVGTADSYEGSWVSAVWVTLMLLGWTFGPVVLGVTAWRSGATWAIPALLAAGVVLMVLDAGRWPLAAGFAATWAGLALAGHAAPAVEAAPATSVSEPAA